MKHRCRRGCKLSRLLIIQSPSKEVRRSKGVKGHHPNLLGIRDSLSVTASHDTAKNYFAVVPMHDCTYGCVCSDISAGHAYLISPSLFTPATYSLLKLGFALLPMPSISQWAAAPELVASHNTSTSNYEQPSPAADIWLVGITALELAYGGLQLPNRNAREAMVKDILHHNDLPPTIETEQQAMKIEHRNLLKHCAKKLPTPRCSSSSSSSFSPAFTSMVNIHFVDHASFIKDVTTTQHLNNLNGLLNMLQMRGEHLVSPVSKKGLVPLVIPLYKQSSGVITALLQWPTAPPGSICTQNEL
ncbi:unnamed protein product [Cuscuta epithymum]|uniref:Protein kinase domain-containing protein n=1 Tax=Cuscuta epithymum TaxID=186058 RepID=A0AAV0FMP6_9ASTE|nr:unnamed protein product [Cuscuta epithymum]